MTKEHKNKYNNPVGTHRNASARTETKTNINGRNTLRPYNENKNIYGRVMPRPYKGNERYNNNPVGTHRNASARTETKTINNGRNTLRPYKGNNMKRLLTYGLLMLTMLAGLFVVSACQEDSDKTTIIMTFTTRVENPPLNTTTGEDVEVPQEAMKVLRIIMAREDGTVIVNQKDAGVDTNPYSLQFDVPMTTYTERFQFVVIANESTLVSSDGTAIDLSAIENLNELKGCVIGQNGFSLDDDSQYIPQTIYWAQNITYGETTNISKKLLFVVSKITVEFKNETQETQSLSDIHIKGIIPSTQGYLLAQDGTDFVGTQHDASAMQASDILFNAVTDLAAGSSSDVQHYYTYPVGTSGIASSTSTFTQSGENYQHPTLFATWNGKEYNLPITEVTDEDGNKRTFTSLARNERLQIVVTLTGQELTVNYTIAPWMEHATNIGSPTPEGGYKTEDWEGGNDVVIGGEDEPGGGEVTGDVLFEGTQIIDWTSSLNYTIPAEKFVACYGKLIGFDFVVTEGKNSITGFIKVFDTIATEKEYLAIPSNAQDGKLTVEMDLRQKDLPENCYLYIDGDGITLKKIYIKNQ